MQLVIPILTALGAVLLLDEPVTARLVAAAVLVGLGMWLAAGRREPVEVSSADPRR